ncbi:MAG: hypothetical protein LQ337_003733 [Flavoplaca oasis]|nr:MAG: hypothetical protein LQ337_003733 [Flavoplaca oasis]
MQQVAKLMPVTGRRTSSVNFASTSDYLQQSGHGNSQDHQNRSDMTASSSTNVFASQDCTASGVGSAESVNKDPSDGVESDDQSASVEDPDVLAPSDMTHNPKHGQTGLNSTNIHETQTGFNDSLKASYSGLEAASPAERAADSDDDDYAGVDLISESGDEEAVVDSLAEKADIDSERGDITSVHLRSPPNSPYDAFFLTSAEAGQIDYDIDPFLTDDIFFKDQINNLDRHDGATDNDYFASTNNFGFASPQAETPRRRVRFADPLMLPTEASRLLLTEVDDGVTSSTQCIDSTLSKHHDERARRGYTPCDGHNEPGDEAVRSTARVSNLDPLGIFEPMNTDDDQDDNDGDTGNSVGSSSGYETDQGETTDEEDVPASATAHPSAVLRDSSSVALESNFTVQPLPQPSSTNLRSNRRWGPKLGSFVTDPTKPIAVVARDGKQLIIYPAQRPASRGCKVFPSLVSSGQSSVQASPRTAVARMTGPSHPTATDDSELDRSEKSSQDISTPMLSASPNLMMSGLGLRRGNMLSGHAMGPPEAFFPFQSIGADGTMMVDGVDVGYDDVSSEDEGEDMLNIEDFINLRGSSADSDQEADVFIGGRTSPASSSPTQSAANPSSVVPSPTQSTFLDHLDKGMVTAFRRNQYQSESDELNFFRQQSKSPFLIANAIKTNAFVASNASHGSSSKRKLSDQYGESPGYDHAPTKRRIPNHC